MQTIIRELIEHATLYGGMRTDGTKMRARFATGILYNDTLIKGSNGYRYGRVEKPIHAECDVLQKGKIMLNSCELARSVLIIIRIRYTMDGTLEYGLSKPCSACHNTIKGIFGKVLYTITHENLILRELTY